MEKKLWTNTNQNKNFYDVSQSTLDKMVAMVTSEVKKITFIFS